MHTESPPTVVATCHNPRHSGGTVRIILITEDGRLPCRFAATMMDRGTGSFCRRFATVSAALQWSADFGYVDVFMS